jgi:hypothetical protein
LAWLLYYFYLVWGVEDDFGFIAIEFDLSCDDNCFAFKGFDVWEFIGVGFEDDCCEWVVGVDTVNVKEDVSPA